MDLRGKIKLKSKTDKKTEARSDAVQRLDAGDHQPDFQYLSFEKQVALISEPTPQEVAFFEDRRSRGLGVGRSADGKIETQKEVNAREASKKSGEHF